jgi:hypothetical protein
VKLSVQRADDGGVGVHDRDWYRDAPPRARSSALRVVLALVVAAAVVVALVTGGVVGFSDLASCWRLDADGVRLQLVPGVAGPVAGEGPLYPAGDRWRAWLAPASVCPGGEQTDAPPAAELATMLCLINYARQHQGVAPLAPIASLNAASLAKANDIVRCGKFEHPACGKAPNQVAIDAGYRGSFGENLYAAQGRMTAPRVALDQWLNSPGHRDNLFRPHWRGAGLAALHGADFAQLDDGVIWVSQFGDP